MYKENFKKAVALILSASIATGMSISVFAADNSNDKYVTREYAVSEFVQSIRRNNLKGNENVLKSFDDSDDIDDEYKADFERVTSNGVVYGYDDSTLKPKEHISRVEALTILARCMEDAEDIEPVRDAIEFTDVPEYRKAERPLQNCREQSQIPFADCFCCCSVGICTAETKQVHIRL